jgi:predicted nucleotidyltransferase
VVDDVGIFEKMNSKVNSKKEVMEQVLQHGDQITGFGVVRIGLFGSFVRDAATEESDVDFLVEFDPSQKTLKNLVGLSRFLRQLLGREVELITPQSLSPLLGRHIIKEVEYVALAA